MEPKANVFPDPTRADECATISGLTDMYADKRPPAPRLPPKDCIRNIHFLHLILEKQTNF